MTPASKTKKCPLCKEREIGLQIQNEAARIKIEAERKAGEMLAGMEKNRGCAIETRSHDATTLPDIGITKSDSSRWQRMASLPGSDLETYASACTAAGRLACQFCRPTIASICGELMRFT